MLQAVHHPQLHPGRVLRRLLHPLRKLHPGGPGGAQAVVQQGAQRRPQPPPPPRVVGKRRQAARQHRGVPDAIRLQPESRQS